MPRDQQWYACLPCVTGLIGSYGNNGSNVWLDRDKGRPTMTSSEVLIDKNGANPFKI